MQMSEPRDRAAPEHVHFHGLRGPEKTLKLLRTHSDELGAIWMEVNGLEGCVRRQARPATRRWVNHYALNLALGADLQVRQEAGSGAANQLWALSSVLLVPSAGTL